MNFQGSPKGKGLKRLWRVLEINIGEFNEGDLQNSEMDGVGNILR